MGQLGPNLMDFRVIWYLMIFRKYGEKPQTISNLMHQILVYSHIIHLLNSSTCFEHYPAHLQEVHVVIAYMQPLVSLLCKK